MAESPKIPEHITRVENVTAQRPEKETAAESFESGKQIAREAAAPASTAAQDASQAFPLDRPFVDADPELKAIEDILAEGMEEFFLHLDAKGKWEFKTKGEETAGKIKTILHAGAYKIKDIVRLIAIWLRGLPGVNRFFLEQEAKIKADRIVERFKQ